MEWSTTCGGACRNVRDPSGRWHDRWVGRSDAGELFASCPYDVTGKSVEATLDSSRCFVVRVESEDGRHAYIGIGVRPSWLTPVCRAR